MRNKGGGMTGGHYADAIRNERTYATFIKEITSKDCCFAHGYVLAYSATACRGFSLLPISLALFARHHYYVGAAAAGIRITSSFIFNLFLEITICCELARNKGQEELKSWRALSTLTRHYLPAIALILHLNLHSLWSNPRTQIIYSSPFE